MGGVTGFGGGKSAVGEETAARAAREMRERSKGLSDSLLHQSGKGLTTGMRRSSGYRRTVGRRLQEVDEGSGEEIGGRIGDWRWSGSWRGPTMGVGEQVAAGQVCAGGGGRGVAWWSSRRRRGFGHQRGSQAAVEEVYRARRLAAVAQGGLGVVWIWCGWSWRRGRARSDLGCAVLREEDASVDIGR